MNFSEASDIKALISSTDYLQIIKDNIQNNKLYYNSQKEAYLPLSEEPIKEEDISNNMDYSNKLLDISDEIIVFDLLNKNKNDLLVKEEEQK